MSMLGEQIKELRKKADMLDGLEGMDNLVRMLREAADTIENLRDSLNEVADKWAGEMIIAEDYARENMMLRANNGSRWFELFGTPERAAQTIARTWTACEVEDGHCESCPLNCPSCCLCCGNYDVLLKWLRGESDGE